MNLLKQSTAVDIALGPFVDATDGVTPETALTLSQADIRLKKNAGAWAQKTDATSATHEENGHYEVNLDATDTNTLGILEIACYESGALPVFKSYMVVPANVYDSIVLGTDYLQADAMQIEGADATDAITAAAGGATAAAVADAVWDEARADHVAAGSFGQGAASVQGNVTGSVGSVTGSVGSVTGAVGSVTGAVGSVTGNVGGNVVGSVGSVTGNVGGSVASVTGAVGSVTGTVTLADVDTLTYDKLMTAFLAVVFGESDVTGTDPTITQTFKDQGGVVVVTATRDADGNRTVVLA